MAPATAASKSASSKTMKGAFPPNSMDVLFTVAAQSAINFFPMGVDPVNVNFFTIGLEVISFPISEVFPTTMFMTPLGTPALTASSVNARADNGVAFAGLHTTVQPAANAGAIFLVSMAFGKFHGVIQATTPTGCFITTIRLSFDGGGIMSPYIRLPSSANHSIKFAPYAISPLDSNNGFPCSAVSI